MCLTRKGSTRGNNVNSNCCCWWLVLSKLPDDLLVEILCRLPEKTLIKFKCVCKSWNRLITHVCVPKISTFRPLWGFLFNAQRATHYVDYIPYNVNPAKNLVDSIFDLIPVEIRPYDWLDCCNGLLLFVMGSLPQYYVCNPTSKQCIEIPRYSAHEIPIGSFAALAFNPSESPYYKIFRPNYLRSCSISKTINVDIFSSDTGKWVTHKMALDAPVFEVTWFRRPLYLNGVMYMLSYSKHLLYFDINEFIAGATELPEKDKTDESGFIGLSRGCLYYSNHDGSKLFIWVLEGRCKACRWILKHTICFNDLAKSPNSSYLDPFLSTKYFKIYAMDPNSDAIFLGVPVALFRYHLEENNLEPVYCTRPDQYIISGHCRLFTYSRCLVVLRNFTTLQGN